MSNAPILTLEWVLQEKAKHKKALADLDAAERLLHQQAEGQPKPPTPAGKGNGDDKNYGTKKRALLLAIGNSPTGLTTQGVITAGTAAGLKGLKAENTSPQLSAYKKAELLALENGLWKITQKGREYVVTGKS
jgi:hypothetical protein